MPRQTNTHAPSQSFCLIRQGLEDAPKTLSEIVADAASPALAGHENISPVSALPFPLDLMAAMLAKEAGWRSEREGVLLLCTDTSQLYGALVFRHMLHAFLEIPLVDAFLPNPGPLDALLDDFRLGWLPAEVVEKHGGHAHVLPNLPPEAEGFRPAFAAGFSPAVLEGRARILAAGEETQQFARDFAGA